MKIDLISMLSVGSGSDFLNKTGSGAAHSTFSKSDISMALASISEPLGSILLRAKYLETDKDKLYIKFGESIRSECMSNNWFVKDKNKDLYELMAYTIIDENFYGRCKHCKGTKLKRKIASGGGYIMVDCEACNSTGYAKPNMSERARKMGLSNSGYAFWNDRFNYFASKFNQIEQKSVSEFSKKLSG